MSCDVIKHHKHDCDIIPDSPSAAWMMAYRDPLDICMGGGGGGREKVCVCVCGGGGEEVGMEEVSEWRHSQICLSWA